MGADHQPDDGQYAQQDGEDVPEAVENEAELEAGGDFDVDDYDDGADEDVEVDPLYPGMQDGDYLEDVAALDSGLQAEQDLTRLFSHESARRARKAAA